MESIAGYLPCPYPRLRPMFRKAGKVAAKLVEDLLSLITTGNEGNCWRTASSEAKQECQRLLREKSNKDVSWCLEYFDSQ